MERAASDLNFVDYMILNISAYLKQKETERAKNVAREFIQWLCELAVKENIGFREETGNPATWVPEIGRFVISCLRARRCAVCGKVHDFEHGDIVDLDHWNTISSSAGNYENDDGLQKSIYIFVSGTSHDKTCDRKRGISGKIYCRRCMAQSSTCI